jgi:hypothetical protein
MCLTRFKRTCSRIPLAETWCRASPGFARRGVRTPRVVKENEADSGTYFLYMEDRGHVHLLYLLDKDEQEDLSSDERNVLRTLVAEIKRTKQGQQHP